MGELADSTVPTSLVREEEGALFGAIAVGGGQLVSFSHVDVGR